MLYDMVCKHCENKSEKKNELAALTKRNNGLSFTDVSLQCWYGNVYIELFTGTPKWWSIIHINLYVH